VTIRTKILAAYELADATDDDNERARQMTFVLVGGGPRARSWQRRWHKWRLSPCAQFRRIDPAKSSIIVIEAGNRILNSFLESLAGNAAKQLDKLGVTVLTGVR
jgi:NADH dehydrogenase